MKDRLFALIAAGCLALCLCGCSVFANDTAEWLTPPALAGEISLIADAVRQSAGGDYTFKYPSRGEYRSAVIQNDLDGDGVPEAFALYAKTENDETTMVLDMISETENTWRSVAKQKIVAGGVDKVAFSDLDGDGLKEILVGWEIYGTSEMQLGVYSFEENTLIQRMLQRYTCFVCCDLDEDGAEEIFLIRQNTAEQTATAALYELNESGVAELYSCELDRTAKITSDLIVAPLSSGKAAVYIDEIKGAGAITEVLFIEKNRLVNPLFNAESGETTATLRSASLPVQDINGDGVWEIPIQENVPSVAQADVNEKLYLTKWCSYNGEILTAQLTAMMNTTDGYYYILPAKLSGQIAVLKDTEEHLREIYRYDAENERAGELLLSFKTVPASKYDSEKFERGEYRLLTRDDVSVFLCKEGPSNPDGFKIADVKKAFKIIE